MPLSPGRSCPEHSELLMCPVCVWRGGGFWWGEREKEEGGACQTASVTASALAHSDQCSLVIVGALPRVPQGVGQLMLCA